MGLSITPIATVVQEILVTHKTLPCCGLKIWSRVVMPDMDVISSMGWNQFVMSNSCLACGKFIKASEPRNEEKNES